MIRAFFPLSSFSISTDDLACNKSVLLIKRQNKIKQKNSFPNREQSFLFGNQKRVDVSASNTKSSAPRANINLFPWIFWTRATDFAKEKGIIVVYSQYYMFS